MQYGRIEYLINESNDYSAKMMDEETRRYIDGLFEISVKDPLSIRVDDIERMLSLDPFSEECEYMGLRARELSGIRGGNVGSVGTAFGIDYRPCSGNCVYCSFGERWGIMDADYEIPADTIVDLINDRLAHGFSKFTLRTTEDYDVRRLAELGREILSRVDGRIVLSANTGELSYEDCEMLADAGFSGAYHTLHLREGEQTSFPPEVRLRTMENIRRSRLSLSCGVDAIGVEHTDREIAENIAVIREYRPVSVCSMKRINPRGTPVADLEEVSDRRIAQIAAVLRFATDARNVSAVPPNRDAMRWGAGGTSVGTGANPRDSVHDPSEVGRWRFDMSRVREMLISEGYDVQDGITESEGIFRSGLGRIEGDGISVGDAAEDFTLESTDGTFTLSERVRDGPVLLYFYVVNYGRTCTDYMALMNERYEQLRSMGVTMVHVNPDTVGNHRAWMEHTGAMYEHLSDPDQKVSRYFGCIVRKARSKKIMGYTDRAFVLIDTDMKIRYIWHAGMPNDTVPMDELMGHIRDALGS